MDGQPAILGQVVGIQQAIELLPAAQSEQLHKKTIMLHKPYGWISQDSSATSAAARQKLAIRLLTWQNQALTQEGTKAACERRGREDKEGGAQKRGGSEAAVEPYRLKGLGIVGRLDAASRGLLIFSQDGNVARTLIHPDAGVDKEYLVTGVACEEDRVRERFSALGQASLRMDATNMLNVSDFSPTAIVKPLTPTPNPQPPTPNPQPPTQPPTCSQVYTCR